MREDVSIGAVRLPRPERGGWLLMLTVGGALVVAGGLGLGLLTVGAGLVLASAAWLVLAGRETSATAKLADDGALELVGDDGLVVRLALEPPARTLHIAGPRGDILAIADERGIVELAALDDDEQNELARITRRAADAASLDQPASVPLPRRVRVQESPLVVRWRSLSLMRAAAWFGLAAGLSCIGAAATHDRIVLWIGFGIALVMAIAIGLGAERRLRIAPGAVEVERALLGRVRKQAVPLSDIVGVDAVKEIGVCGPGIVFRTTPLGERPTIAHPGTHVPTEGLSLAARVSIARLVATAVFASRADEV